MSESNSIEIQAAISAQFASKKKKKKKEKKVVEKVKLYEFSYLLDRIFLLIQEKNPSLLLDKKRFKMIAPIVHKEGAKKTGFDNIVEISIRLNREVEHIMMFLLTELGTTGSLDSNQRLIIKGKFQQANIESILRAYIVTYVKCETCKSFDTGLIKENRLFFISCKACGSRRSVQGIKQGFQAQTVSRKALKAKEGQ